MEMQLRFTLPFDRARADGGSALSEQLIAGILGLATTVPVYTNAPALGLTMAGVWILAVAHLIWATHGASRSAQSPVIRFHKALFAVLFVLDILCALVRSETLQRIASYWILIP
jgi:hypothetical protein